MKTMNKVFCAVLAMILALGMTGIATADTAWTAAAPNGAPALSLAMVMKDNPGAVTLVAADTIAAEFSKGESDFLIAPINAGAKLFKAGKSTYLLAAVVTWGNLVFASQKEGFKAEDMNGATITLFGENTINASIALYALEKNGITPDSVEYLGGAAETQSLLLTDADAIVMTAEPAVTAAKVKNENVTSIAVNDLYKQATGLDGFTQAGLFVKKATAEEKPEMTQEFLRLAKASCDACETDVTAVAEAAVALEILKNTKIAEAAIPNCNVRYAPATEVREQIETTAGIDLKQYGGELPADDFYYAANDATP